MIRFLSLIPWEVQAKPPDGPERPPDGPEKPPEYPPEGPDCALWLLSTIAVWEKGVKGGRSEHSI
jgi:hypothetical protein